MCAGDRSLGGRAHAGVLRRRETLHAHGNRRTRGKKSLSVPGALQAPMPGGASNSFQAPGQALQVSEQHQPHMQQRQRPASFPQRRAPAPVLRLTPRDPPLRGAPGIPGQMVLNWTQSSARNQASGLFLPTQTSTSTKIFQAGRAAFSGMDSSRFESLPHCIFNVLTYALHGPGLAEAPLYR